MKLGREKILQLCVIAIVGIGLGIVARLILIDVYEKDNTTANWTMFAVIAGFILLYFLFLEIYNPLAARFTRKKSNSEVEESPVEEKKEEPRPQVIQEEKSEEVVPVAVLVEKKPTVTDLKLESFGKYCTETMSKYVTPDDLERLMNYVGQYVRKDKSPIPAKIPTKDLDTYDLLHFGWNMWKHFKETKQPEVAVWLKKVFVALKDVDISTIEHNLKHKDKGRNYLIMIVENIE